MAAKLDWMLSRARRLANFARGNCRAAPLLSLALALAALGGCRHELTRKNLENERFLDQYAAGRGLTREQARREVETKVSEQEAQKMVNAAEDQGVVAPPAE
ncbi:MAG TPA: hypothetical protein VMV10_30345 [Pirellulales bacterium]|nr:hypothetical protein [Pirellulales bacterium]